MGFGDACTGRALARFGRVSWLANRHACSGRVLRLMLPACVLRDLFPSRLVSAVCHQWRASCCGVVVPNPPQASAFADDVKETIRMSDLATITVDSVRAAFEGIDID